MQVHILPSDLADIVHRTIDADPAETVVGGCPLDPGNYTADADPETAGHVFFEGRVTGNAAGAADPRHRCHHRRWPTGVDGSVGEDVEFLGQQIGCKPLVSCTAVVGCEPGFGSGSGQQPFRQQFGRFSRSDKKGSSSRS